MSDDDWLTSREPGPAVPQRVAVAPSRDNTAASGGGSEVKQVLLLQRPKDAVDRNASVVEDRPAPKSLKQKEAEYAAARARIFGKDNNSSAVSRDQGYGRGGRGGYGNGGGRGGGQRNYGAPVEGRRRAGKADAADDPDYDRRPELYAPKLAPSEPMPDYDRSEALHLQQPVSRYTPPTYESEFPALGR
mmetsp:Transcript_74447/g.177338  ORF Transcript_74447/g.177338 Transcript_74447/m.177338 type:complete len:189 (-) Transcript_74447:155-721(-)